MTFPPQAFQVTVFLVQAMRDQGFLQIFNQTELEITNNLSNFTTPSSVQEVTMARLDRLDPEALMVLKVASVVGMEFGLEMVTELLPKAHYAGDKVSLLIADLMDHGIIDVRCLVPVVCCNDSMV